ncbi:MAG: hypothetical protein PHU21_05360 [Elusimicrobia bacterium]|nr:hypothetical protein [Elusimicrobiota bacterium]
MDTKLETPQIPELKLANVGADRRKKKGAVPFWLGGSGTAARSGGGVWSSISGIAGTSGIKIAVALLAGTVGVGAYNTGKTMRPDESQFERQNKPQLFASKNEKPKYEGDLSKLPGPQAGGQNSVTMVSGSLDGLTAEERAAKAAKEEADAKAAAEAQAKADAEAAAKEQANVPAGPDPAALAAAQAAAAAKEKEKEAAFSRRFGELSKGSGLSGGSGMSAGIGQGFAPLKAKPGDAGALSAFGSRRTGTGTTSSRISAGRNPGRSLAQRQLNRAVQSARQAKAGPNESRSAATQVPFDTGVGNNQLLTGSGGGVGGASPRSGTSDSRGSGGGGSGSPVGVGGNSVASGPDDCGDLASKYGWHGNFVNSADGGCVLKEGNVKGTGKDDPTNKYFDMLKLLSIIATILSAFLLLAGFLQKSVVPATMMLGFAMAKVCGAMLCAVGAIIALLGLMVVGMGRKSEGTIFAIMGVLTSAAGYMAYSSAEKAAEDAKAVEAAGKEQTTQMRDLMKNPNYTVDKGTLTFHQPGTTNQWSSVLVDNPGLAGANQSVMSAGNTSIMTGSLSTGSNLYGDFHDVDPRTWNPDTQRWE